MRRHFLLQYMESKISWFRSGEGRWSKVCKKNCGKFGKDTLDVIEETPDELLKVSGIGKVRVDRIKTSWQEQKEIKNIMLFCRVMRSAPLMRQRFSRRMEVRALRS